MKDACAKVIILLLVTFLMIISCTAEEPPPVLRISLETEPSTLDPVYAVDYSSGMITSLIHSNLVRVGPEGGIVPGLAEDWDIVEGGKSYIFDLGPARFSNGRRVIAEDVLFSFKRLLSPSALSPRWWVLGPLRGANEYHNGGEWDSSAIEILDDSTVVFRLDEPTAHFLSLLTMPSACIVCREALKGQGEGKYYGRPVGSGPWALSDWSRGDRMMLVPNQHFYEDLPLIDGISIRFLPVAMTRIAEFEVGNLDILQIPYADLNRWRSAGAYLESKDELRVVYIGLNVTRSPFDDPDVRRALNMAVDVDAIIAKILFGAGRRAIGTIPHSLRRGKPTPDAYDYNPDAAVELLEKAGLGEGFSMEIWQRESPEGGRILESVQGYLGMVGVDVRLVTRDWSAFKEAVNQGTPDAFYLDWFADYPDPENFITPLFHSLNRGGGGNRTGYSEARVDSLIDAASRCTGEEDRMALLLEAESAVYNDAPWIFLWFPTNYEAVSPRLKGYRMPLIFNGQDYLNVYF